MQFLNMIKSHSYCLLILSIKFNTKDYKFLSEQLLKYWQKLRKYLLSLMTHLFVSSQLSHGNHILQGLC